MNSKSNNIPNTLEEAVHEIVSKLSKDDLSLIGRETEDEVVTSCHHGSGRSIRNKWSLWGDSPLKKDLQSKGFTHPDDMSSVIMRCVIRQVKGKDWGVEERAQYYKKYWAKMRERVKERPDPTPFLNKEWKWDNIHEHWELRFGSLVFCILNTEDPPIGTVGRFEVAADDEKDLFREFTDILRHNRDVLNKLDLD